MGKKKKMEDNLNFKKEENGRQPKFYFKTRMTTSNKNERWPQKNKTEDDLKNK
jgi:hypothetical protein